MGRAMIDRTVVHVRWPKTKKGVREKDAFRSLSVGSPAVLPDPVLISDI
jgi:hypothetical protein